MKTKRLMSIVLALAMLCTMFGNLTAFADEVDAETHNHPMCGSECDGTCVEGTHKDVIWQPISEVLTSNSYGYYIKQAGNYFLDKDYDLGSLELQVSADVNICLNGHKLKSSNNTSVVGIQNDECDFAITDCSNDNTGIILDTASGHSISYSSYYAEKTVNIYDGTFQTEGNSTAVIGISGQNLVVNIYGGNFNQKENYGACIDVNVKEINIYDGNFQMYKNTSREMLLLNSTKIVGNIYGGDFDCDVRATAIKSYGHLNLYNIDGIKKQIFLGSLDDGQGINICKTLTKPNVPITIDCYDYNYDFTSGWNTYMNGNDPADYFTPKSTEFFTLINEKTGEAHFYTYPAINIDENIKNGTVKSDVKTAKKGTTVTLTVTPDEGYKLNEISAKDGDGNTVNLTKATEEGISTQSASEEYTFTMPAKAVSVTADFNFDTPFTVKAVVNSATEDVDADKDGTQVNAKDTVKVDVAVSGGAFTNADWEMIYDPTLFEYKSTTTNVDATKGTVTTDDTKTAVLSGKLIANAGLSTGDEFTDGTAIVTYEFTAKAQNADKTGTFKIESAHANNYTIAGTQDNKVANTENTTVEIVLVDDTEDKDEENGTVTVPAGTFTAAEKVYNAQKQTGNAFELDEDFAGAKVTYFANEDGTAVENTADLASKSFKTTLPSWKDVGTYTYYAKIYGDGLKTTYVSTTLTIKKATLVPSAMFTVDPSTGTNDVEFVPTLEGALDGTHNGTVTVTYTDKDGAQSVELQASDFVYDGETTSVYNGTIKTTAATSGEFTVTLTYEDGTNDNYTGGTNTAKVDVDKITANKVTVDALEETITSVFGYDSTAHSVEINADAVTTVTNGDWKYTISDEDATVTNVGDDKMVKVTFTDKNGVYNDVIVYVILKVTPANVKITVDDQTKVMNEDDPELTGTVKVVDEDGNAVEGMDANKLYGEDDLEVSYEREAGEAVGTYDITASYAPNDNYTVEVENGTFTITAPVIDPDDETKAIVKVEVVDLSKGNTNGDETPDYTANKRLILVYTDVDKLFYGYKVDENTTEKMFDVTAAGYKYVDNDYEAGTYTEDTHEYKHVYGIVVDAIDNYEATETYEKKYRDNVVFLSSDLSDAPVNIVYDGDINLSNEIDVNDYSMTNGIYNNQYARATYIKNILKADINGDKKVDTTDVANVKGIYEAKN